MGKHVLVIEDERPLSHAIELKLSFAGYRVTIANDGKEGLEAIKNDPPDLVLTDLIMPVMDGFELLTEIQRQKLPVKVIVLSNLGQEEDIQRTKDLGAVDFFIKADFALSELVEMVNKYLK